MRWHDGRWAREKKEVKGKERKGKERKGKERKGKEWNDAKWAEYLVHATTLPLLLAGTYYPVPFPRKMVMREHARLVPGTYV